MSAVDVSVVVPTYNRAALLEQAVRSVFRQCAPGVRFEIVVVDNNSPDDTANIVAALQLAAPVPLRYIRERRQGNAYARNAGVEQSRGAIVAFMDDDVVADENWIAAIKSALDRDPGLSFVGGRCLPLWENEPPSWLTPSHWAPLAMLDYGPHELEIAGQMPRGLLTANIAIRKCVFDELGGFLPALQRVNGSIGSMEDHEFLSRMCRSGRRGRYVPELITRGYLHPERTTKRYHRRWHRGHGHFYAVLNDHGWEGSRWSVFGVPMHLYRRTLGSGVRWAAHMLSGRTDAAFADECELHFFRGFFRQRVRQRRAGAVARPTGGAA